MLDQKQSVRVFAGDEKMELWWFASFTWCFSSTDSHGSTGQRQDPGKVFKGKEMAGHGEIN